MALSFNHATKRIGVPQADAVPLLIQALINAIREEEASERGICHDQIADAAGKADLGGGVLTGITLNLRDAWALEFAAGVYQATITGGNLADALARVSNTGSPQVLVQASAAATVVDGSGGTAPTAGQVADAVRAELTADLVRLMDLARIHGLIPGEPLVVTQTARTAGEVNQSITEEGGTVTVSRN